ncbi:histone-lysine N-methyltransferase eggless [Glossina fuscipes]|uniref:Histone-lysine N-methyltransferase eggless n=1 Tax=Glossina fuscipes TaxID=7396 RepID=A0A9C5ZB81_9MUSC|nr:histone-lysine N-methyltransferase eggless [Glossina fuscipes]
MADDIKSQPQKIIGDTSGTSGITLENVGNNQMNEKLKPVENKISSLEIANETKSTELLAKENLEIQNVSDAFEEKEMNKDSAVESATEIKELGESVQSFLDSVGKEFSKDDYSSAIETEPSLDKITKEFMSEECKQSNAQLNLDHLISSKPQIYSDSELLKERELMENLETCDSQESTKLIIDETSIEEENKYNKNDQQETEMIANEQIEMVLEQNANSVDKTKSAENAEELTFSGADKVVDEMDMDEKDEDVLHVEGPAVPIIEIDDDDEPVEKPPYLSVQEKQISALTNMETSKPEEAIERQDVEMKELTPEVTTEIDGKTNESLLEKAAEKQFVEVVAQSTDANGSDNGSCEVFYNKECINYECPHDHKQYLQAPLWALSYFQVNKKKFKSQYVCVECYDKSLDMYEEFSGLLNAKYPLLTKDIPTGRQEFVEIIDSSDEEDTTETAKSAEENSKPSFSKSDFFLIENELDKTIKNVLNKIDIQSQLTWSKTILTQRLKHLEVECSCIEKDMRLLQKKADKMHEALYQCPKIKLRQLQPLDLNSGLPFSVVDAPEVQQIPPVGEVERISIQLNGTYYAVKNNAIARWVPCKVTEQVDSNIPSQKNAKQYKIKFLKSQYQMLKTVPAKHLAYYEPPAVRLPTGARVIAYFDATSLTRGKEKVTTVQSAFYPGIIAEPLKPNNKFRYLIFYDDGYTQYVYHKDVRLVCQVSENVWEDVHPTSRDFIQKYLTQYSINRPMVQTQKGQSMSTQSNGYWLHARVIDIDCSLVLMQFEGTRSHTEWIYRGSLRLGPVFKEYQKSLQKHTNVPVSRLPRRTEPFIRYTQDEDSSAQQQTEKARAVARKSFGRPESITSSVQGQITQTASQMPVKHLNNSTIYVEDENKPKGKVVYYTAKRNLPPRKFVVHNCSPSCLIDITHNLSAYSPLSKPLLSGWERFILRQKIKKAIAYRAPCGKILRNMKELRHYLRLTNNVLNVDNFDFSHETNCLAEYVIESAIVQKRDISGGQEKMAIPLVNYYDNTLPPECKYSAKVIPTEGVHINTEKDFLVGCDCDDDCSDKSRCSCWQLTLAGAKYGNANTPSNQVGYQYKRLLEHVPTGIYECNARCKCKSNCLNRVVQHSLQMKLQVFKTSNRGWGLRCINDIPRGSFVCIYAGHLLTEAKANEGGLDAGDEYFAELDYIEVAEQIKEGYESEVEPPEPEDEEPYNPEQEDDDEFTPSKSYMSRSKAKMKNARSNSQQFEDEFQERQVISFNPNADINEDSGRESSIRKLFGKDEACYVMDAKITGNLGRYFNHSCSPNLFVQNVFVDTHDLRFPWVAFFASCHIRAGTELTWNYNYEVGVVPGKVLYCQCGAPNCRLRLL